MNNYQYEEAAMPYSPDASTESTSPIQDAKQRHERELMAIEGVEGVGIGRNSIGNDAILVYLRSEDVKSSIPRSIAGHPVETIVTGTIDAL